MIFTSFATLAVAEVELYGVATFGQQSLNYGPESGNNQDISIGRLYGASLYIPATSDIEIGLDFLGTSQKYTSWRSDAELNSLSAMVSGRYSTQIFDSTSAYFGGGLGGIQLDYSDSSQAFDGKSYVGGYQLELGIRKEINNLSVFTGIKYQSGLGQATIQNQNVQYNSLGITAGFRF